MSNIIIYIPVLHAGYEKFIRENSQVGDIVYLLDGECLVFNFPEELGKLCRDLRAVTPKVIRAGLQEVFGNSREFRILNKQKEVSLIVCQIISSANSTVMHDDDISHVVLESIQNSYDKEKVLLKKTFLRWDKNASLLEKEVFVPVISSKSLPENIVFELQSQISKSVDWWRQVACVVFNNQGEIVFAAYNKHYPNDLVLNILGDPRFNFKPGEHIENCSAIHSESWIVARAAREGISLKGLNMFVSDFPCPICGKLISETGISNLYFVRGYSKIDSQKTLEDSGIKIQKIAFEQ